VEGDLKGLMGIHEEGRRLGKTRDLTKRRSI